MYKEFKITKRLSFAINRFPISAKKPPYNKTYLTGIHKSYDDINSFKSIFIVIGTLRLIIYIQDKNPKGHSFC